MQEKCGKLKKRALVIFFLRKENWIDRKGKHT